MTAPIIASRMRTPLILALNFTFAVPWPDMTEPERAASLRAILAELSAEALSIDAEIARSVHVVGGASGPRRPLDGLLAELRPGVAYTVLRAPDGPPSALVVLTDHADAEIGEWAIFRGWASGKIDPPSRIVTAPDRAGLRFFANPRRYAGLLIYQRVLPEGDEVFTMGDTTPQDEAAAARA